MSEAIRGESMPQPDHKYAKLAVFIRSVIEESGYTKSSGEPNVSAFYHAYKDCLDKPGSPSISPASFGKFVNGLKADPDRIKMEAVAVLLSTATRSSITLSDLDALVDQRSLTDFKDAINPELIPDEFDVEAARARSLLDNFRNLRLEARSIIAPEILILLGKDWEYFESPDISRFSRLLQAEIKRRGISLEEFALDALKNIIPLSSLVDIRECRIPPKLFKQDQLIAFRNNVRNIDGGQLTLEDLDCLSLKAQRVRRP